MFDEPRFHEKMAALSRRHEEVLALLGDPEVIARRAEFSKLSREHAELEPLVGAWARYRKLRADLDAARQMVAAETDPELRELARDEARTLDAERDATEQAIKILLLPKDPNDAKNTMLEIRAGTGGDEAALFAADLYRMYSRFAERHGWKCDVMSSSPGAAGGWKEIIVLIEGKDVYSRLKWESGVHRVQRVPATEAQGRIHTSAATVAVLPEAEEVDVKIEDKDLRYDVQRASRLGRAVGQHHRLGGAPDPPPDRHRRLLPGREVPAQEQGQGAQGAALAPLRSPARAAPGRRARQPAARWSAPAIAPRRSGPTTSRRTASPITASASPSTTCRR
jgi:protein subunit release factor A